jgi:hypothetical protein
MWQFVHEERSKRQRDPVTVHDTIFLIVSLNGPEIM